MNLAHLKSEIGSSKAGSLHLGDRRICPSRLEYRCCYSSYLAAYVQPLSVSKTHSLSLNRNTYGFQARSWLQEILFAW